jgi:hypothetical protein
MMFLKYLYFKTYVIYIRISYLTIKSNITKFSFQCDAKFGGGGRSKTEDYDTAAGSGLRVVLLFW